MFSIRSYYPIEQFFCLLQVQEIENGERDAEPAKAVIKAKADGKAGGAYIPPFRLAQMMQETTSKTDPAYQRLSWDALRKSINGLVNKANAQNIRPIIKELLSEVSIILIALFSEVFGPHVSCRAFKRLCRVEVFHVHVPTCR